MPQSAILKNFLFVFMSFLVLSEMSQAATCQLTCHFTAYPILLKEESPQINDFDAYCSSLGGSSVNGYISQLCSESTYTILCLRSMQKVEQSATAYGENLMVARANARKACYEALDSQKIGCQPGGYTYGIPLTNYDGEFNCTN